MLKNEISDVVWNEEIAPEVTNRNTSLTTLDETNYSTVRRTFITNKDKDFVKSLRDESHRICKESINPLYLKKAFGKFKEGFLYNDEIGRRLAFCIWNINEIAYKDDKASDYVMNLLLICSKYSDLKLSRNMFFDMENYCKEKGIRSIEMQAANTNLEKYYETFGFRTEPRFDGLIQMRKIIFERLNLKQTKKNKTTNVKQTRKKPKEYVYHI